MNEKWWLHIAGLATKQGIDSVCPTAANVAAFFLSRCRLWPGSSSTQGCVSAEPHQQVEDGAGQNYP